MKYIGKSTWTSHERLIEKFESLTIDPPSIFAVALLCLTSLYVVDFKFQLRAKQVFAARFLVAWRTRTLLQCQLNYQQNTKDRRKRC